MNPSRANHAVNDDRADWDKAVVLFSNGDYAGLGAPPSSITYYCMRSS